MKQIFAVILSLLLGISVFAQNEGDALRYSTITYTGTARFNGLAGAYGAIGADFSSLSQNPAGIGLYRKSELSITPNYYNNNISSTFMGKQSSDYRGTVYLSNIGYVWAINNNDGASALRQFQLGVGINLLNTYNNRMIIKGVNNTNSLLSSYRDSFNRTKTWDDFGSGLGFDVEAIFYTDSTKKKCNIDYTEGKRLSQIKTLENKGNASETVLSLGANFIDKIYVGATFGFTDIGFTEQSIYTEDEVDSIPFFNSIKRNEYLRTVGSGFNFKVGVIYKPIEIIRLGLALHTPTSYYNMNDKWNASMTAKYDNGFTKTAKSPNGEFDYRLVTPMRLIASGAILIGQSGLISADYEYVDFTSARLRSNDYDFMNENDAIQNSYKPTHNFRIGAEYKYNIFALRAGYAYYASPYKNETELGSRSLYSMGIGIREQGYFIDLAYQMQHSKNNYYLYDIAPVSENNYTANSISLTLGLRF